MIEDHNKSIEISYNTLNLPAQISFVGTNRIEYNYHIKDHLGNVRVTVAQQGVFDTKVTESSNYYPFGMLTNNSSSMQIDTDNPYKYNGKELHADFDLHWHDYGARYYDAQRVVFTGIDPIAEDFNWVSTYNYAENRPISGIDLWGLQKVHFAKNLQNNKHWYHTYYTVRATAMGKKFIQALENQTKYDIYYFSYSGHPSNGVTYTIANYENFSSIKYIALNPKRFRSNRTKGWDDDFFNQYFKDNPEKNNSH